MLATNASAAAVFQRAGGCSPSRARCLAKQSARPDPTGRAPARRAVVACIGGRSPCRAAAGPGHRATVRPDCPLRAASARPASLPVRRAPVARRHRRRRGVEARPQANRRASRMRRSRRAAAAGVPPEKAAPVVQRPEAACRPTSGRGVACAVSAILRRSCCHALATRYLANIRPQDIAKFGHHIRQALGRPRDGRPTPPGSAPRGLARRPCSQSCIVGGSSTTTTRPEYERAAPDRRTWSRMRRSAERGRSAMAVRSGRRHPWRRRARGRSVRRHRGRPDVTRRSNHQRPRRRASRRRSRHGRECGVQSAERGFDATPVLQVFARLTGRRMRDKCPEGCRGSAHLALRHG
jgi:hypothetical protein